MKIIKSDKQIAEEEERQREQAIKEQIYRETKHKSWKKSDYFNLVMEIVDEEIDKTNNISLIPMELTIEERGQYALAMQIAYKRLKEIKKRLSF